MLVCTLLHTDQSSVPVLILHTDLIHHDGDLGQSFEQIVEVAHGYIHCNKISCSGLKNTCFKYLTDTIQFHILFFLRALFLSRFKALSQ